MAEWELEVCSSQFISLSHHHTEINKVALIIKKNFKNTIAPEINMKLYVNYSSIWKNAGKRIWKRMNICKCIIESLCYTSIKWRKEKSKNVTGFGLPLPSSFQYPGRKAGPMSITGAGQPLSLVVAPKGMEQQPPPLQWEESTCHLSSRKRVRKNPRLGNHRR